jgi:hypothetical protein
MGNDAARGLLLATRTSLAMLLTLPLLVLVGVMNSHPEAIVVLSVGLGVHAALCLLISRRLPSEGRYLLLTGVFLLLGVLSAALVNLRLGYDLSESFALIFGVVVAATAHRRLSLAEGCRAACGLLGRAVVSGGAVPLLFVHIAAYRSFSTITVSEWGGKV